MSHLPNPESDKKFALIAVCIICVSVVGGGGYWLGQQHAGSNCATTAAEQSTEFTKKEVVAFVSGMQIFTKSEPRGRLRATQSGVEVREYELLRDRLYDETGEPASLPEACAAKRMYQDYRCEFIPDKPFDSPATAVE